MSVFRHLGSIDQKRFYFGTLEGGHLSGEQNREFQKPFTCGLIALGTSAELVSDVIFGALFGLGCRGIAILGPQSDELSRRFNRRTLDAMEVFVVKKHPWIWTTAHDDPREWFAALATTGEELACYLMQVDSDDFASDCERLIVKHWLEGSNSRWE